MSSISVMGGVRRLAVGFLGFSTILVGRARRGRRSGDPRRGSGGEGVRSGVQGRVRVLALLWVAQSHGGAALDPLPEERDFRAVCVTLPENIRRCMFEGYRVSHKDSCEAMLSRIDAPTGSKIDSLFLAAAAPQPAP